MPQMPAIHILFNNTNQAIHAAVVAQISLYCFEHKT